MESVTINIILEIFLQEGTFPILLICSLLSLGFILMPMAFTLDFRHGQLFLL